MPGAKTFARSFGLSVGRTFAGWKLVHRSISEKAIIQYKQYSYPMHLTFHRARNDASSAALLAALNHVGHQERTVNSRFGNPYRCSIPKGFHISKAARGGNEIRLLAMGKATRIRSGGLGRVSTEVIIT